MKNIIILSFALMLFVTGAANSASTTVSYQVSASADDGFTQSATVQDTTASYLKIGDDRTYAIPYQVSGMRFNNLNIPRSATITNAYLKISSINTDYRGQIYGVIAAEASGNPADFSGRLIGNAALTTSSVAWDFKDAWSPDTQYISPDISNIVQEVVNRPGFSSGNSIAIYYSTRGLSNKARSFASYEYSPASAAVLEITCKAYTISGHILTTGAVPLEGVSVSAGTDNESGSDTTDSEGYYEISVPENWSGTVIPFELNRSFEPVSRSYNNITADQTGQDYTIIPYITLTYQVSASEDNATASQFMQHTGPANYLAVGYYYEEPPPFSMSAMRFRNINIPQGAFIVDAEKEYP